MESTQTSPERQSILDAHIKARIRDELEHLKGEEEHVRQEIERALQRENLDREKSMAGEASDGDGASVGDVKNSAALLGDLEEVRMKIEKYHANRNTAEFPQVEASSAALVECYR
jgi:altered-inheritance-of-mitochondria protein 13